MNHLTNWGNVPIIYKLLDFVVVHGRPRWRCSIVEAGAGSFAVDSVVFCLQLMPAHLTPLVKQGILAACMCGFLSQQRDGRLHVQSCTMYIGLACPAVPPCLSDSTKQDVLSYVLHVRNVI